METLALIGAVAKNSELTDAEKVQSEAPDLVMVTQLAKSRRVAGWTASMAGSVAKPHSRMVVSLSNRANSALRGFFARKGFVLFQT